MLLVFLTILIFFFISFKEMIQLKAPGRICLFGEHQDYLNYPVIAMAISKYIYLEAEKISANKFLIELPDMQQTLEIPLNNKELEYESKRDYLRSGYNQFLRRGIYFNKGYKIKIKGDIPINAGAGSSSALVIAWLYFLNLISDKRLTKIQLANEGYNAEVKEFGESGGKMDHFTSLGGLIYLEPLKTKVLEFPIKLNGFVLGNSLEKKDTVEDLTRVKNLSINSFKNLKEIMPNFNQFTTSLEELKHFLPSIEKEYQKKIIGNIINRDITIEAKNLILNNLNLLKKQINTIETINFYQKLGDLLNIHQEQLRINIGISTKKIDRMINNCLESGALGAKINGSGFGGTMFAFGQGNEDILIHAMEDGGGEAFSIKTSNGVETY